AVPPSSGLSFRPSPNREWPSGLCVETFICTTTACHRLAGWTTLKATFSARCPNAAERRTVNGMPLKLLSSEKAHFLALDSGAFDALVAEWGWPVFRAQQVRDWIYSKLIDAPDTMSNIGMADRVILRQRIAVIT